MSWAPQGYRTFSRCQLKVVVVSTDPEPSDSCGRECFRLLQQLHESTQRLWEVTDQSLHSLRQRLHDPPSVGLEALLLLNNADYVLQAHVE